MASNRYQKCVLRKWWAPSIEVQRGFETAVPHQHQPGFLHEHLSGCLQLLSRETHGLPQRTAEQVPRVLDMAGTNGGVETRTTRRCLAQKLPDGCFSPDGTPGSRGHGS